MQIFKVSSQILFLPVLLLLVLAGCDQSEQTTADTYAKETTTSAKPGCQNCHAVQLDINHKLACSTCHNGDITANTEEGAHLDLTGLPAHPLNMNKTCGKCHQQQTKSASKSIHFTLSKEINSVRKAFGATNSLHSLTEIPIEEPTTTPLALADDMLRRRCLRCHLYYQGDPYPETEHGTGCAACHLDFQDNALQSHSFNRYPNDKQCLHCHNGNRVGSDYYGRFQRDYSWEYRTPYRTDDTYPRPYGVEFHQLQPDIHQQAGIACIDCHSGAQLMGSDHNGTSTPLTCQGCHGWQPGQTSPAANLIAKDRQLILITKHEHKSLPVPLMKNPAHRQYKNKATCVACHAQWSFNDQNTQLMRQDTDDYDPWSLLTVQESVEVEAQLENNLYGDDNTEPTMIDKLSGEPRPGLWYKGFKQRRWETMVLCADTDKRITVCRPSLDLHLSYVNANEEVVFDSVATTPATKKIRPYTPHTIGKAGSFFRQRLSHATDADNPQEKP